VFLTEKVEMITSSRNAKLGNVRHLLSQTKARRDEHAFVVEGVRLTEEAFSAGCQIRMVLWSEDLTPRGQELLSQIQAGGILCEQVESNVLRSVGDTQTPQGILAVVEMPDLSLPDQSDFFVVLDNLRDPGNLGTILRTASAAGVQAVLLSPGCVDPYNPKVVRAAMGAHFHMPICAYIWPEIASILSNVPVYLSDAAGDMVYTQANFRSSLAILVCSEADGASNEASKLASQRVAIPMPGHAESLNAAVAAALLIYEVLRQRG